MARAYGKHPNVIYEIYNKPERESWDAVKAYSETIIKAIGEVDPDNIILVGSPHWDQEVTTRHSEQPGEAGCPLQRPLLAVSVFVVLIAPITALPFTSPLSSPTWLLLFRAVCGFLLTSYRR